MRLATGVAAALLLVGCDGIKLCNQCKKQANPPPQTVKFDVNWRELGEAFKNIPTERKHSITTEEPVKITLTLKGLEGSKTVTVAGWQELVDAVRAVGGRPCIVCPVPGTGGEITHNINHSTFEFRFAPPWFNADQRSLFTSYVVFPAEASLDKWSEDPDRSCGGPNDLASVCPDVAFHREVTGPFLKALAQCATKSKKVTLHTVGFASSSGIAQNTVPEWLAEAYEQHIREIGSRCDGTLRGTERGNVSAMFNLLVANRRAANSAEMLRGLTPAGKFEVEDMPWCSHQDMVEERNHRDRSNGSYDRVRGLMNRRAEVRLTDLSGCLNVHPDNRILNGGETKPD